MPVYQRAVLGTTALLLGGGLALGSQPAGAAGAPEDTRTPVASQVAPGDSAAGTQAADWCGYGGAWGGTFYCNSNYEHTLPNGYVQVFVIGTNKQAYTKWNSSSGLSGWKSLGGQCIEPGNDSIDLAWVNSANRWNFAVQCKGTDHKVYYKQRYANGQWSGWYRP
ncbi:hypothetical protein QF026_003650 [Streptomyces aurantiacus]|uniref:hypothetical protein n=1 Tax=Streptomyces aurantiacus TaxID=47760 RepID=UPI00278DB6E4|nr:hypothetical protein [Streptomyces aurantiacus]MDQ0775184.1 hypothetical protein [Streptomyces aurantiacus]